MTAIGFPPQPVYPNAIDSDRTLFLVYNTTESKLSADNEPWSSEINIIPVKSDEPEIWADNGFGNIDGELFYYDSVGKDENGKVKKLKKCARNLGGDDTHYVKANGKYQVRGYVIAEHHNQLVDTILQIEKFIGYNFDPDITTLDYRIRCLRNVPLPVDDFTCPSVTFTINTVEEDSTIGTLIEYKVEIEGDFNYFRLSFGDGEYVDTVSEGTHRYPPGVVPDPVVTLTSTNCQICATPSSRSGNNALCNLVENEDYTILLPDTPVFPGISIPDLVIPAPQVELPPLVLPCVELNVPPFPSTFVSISIPEFVFPSINIPNINISIPETINIVPSEIIITPPVIPILPSEISFGPVPYIPTLIEFGPVDIPTLIEFGPVDFPTLVTFTGTLDVPDTISFGPAPYIPTLIEFGPIGEIPTLISITPVDIPSLIYITPVDIPSIITVVDTIPEVISVVGQFTFPSFINITDINLPSLINVIDSIPEVISVIDNIPEVISLIGSLPTEISITPVDIPTLIEFGPINIPSIIEIVGCELPSIIAVSAEVDVNISIGNIPDISLIADIPSIITVIDDIPEIISIVGDIPSVISISGNIPSIISFADVTFPIVQFEDVNFPNININVNIPTIISFASITFPLVSFADPPTVSVDWGTPPAVSVDWGTPPTCSCVVTVECPSAGAAAARAAFTATNNNIDTFLADGFVAEDAQLDSLKMAMEIESLGIPSEIKILPPKSLPTFQIENNLPEKITIEAVNIPDSIAIKHDIPREIQLVDNLPKFITLQAPDSIKLDTSTLPKSLLVEVDVPDKIEVIGMPGQIEVIGIPDFIQVVHDIPRTIELLMPEDPTIKLQMPESPKIEMVYEGSPIELKVNLGVDTVLNGEGENPCVMLVPCKPK